jgi:hypothetical protein
MRRITTEADRVENERKIITMARMLCATSTKRRAKYTVAAYVPWSALTELREALTAAGYDLDNDRQIIADHKEATP